MRVYSESTSDGKHGYIMRGHEHIYSVDRLIRLTSDSQRVRIHITPKITYLFDETRWENGAEGITPRSVMGMEHDVTGNVERMRKANLRYPILVHVLPDGRYDVLDGLHRLAKAFSLGHVTIVARLVTDKVLQGAEMIHADVPSAL
jgi:hypothetical protein